MGSARDGSFVPRGHLLSCSVLGVSHLRNPKYPEGAYWRNRWRTTHSAAIEAVAKDAKASARRGGIVQKDRWQAHLRMTLPTVFFMAVGIRLAVELLKRVPLGFADQTLALGKGGDETARFLDFLLVAQHGQRLLHTRHGTLQGCVGV